MTGPSTGALAMDRHLFASSDSAFDTAWETVATTASLPMDRAGRLEERVPWAADLADRDAPPVLVGGDGQRSPLGALPMSFLPLDGRLGLSVSGMILDLEATTRTHSPDRSRRPRVATHTLLFDEPTFRQAAGFPLGLLSPGAPGVSPRGWFDDFREAPLAEGPSLSVVTLAGDPRVTAAMETQRLATVRSLGRRCVQALGVDDAVGGLARAYHHLARTGDPSRIEVGGALGPPSLWAEMVLLTWLTLPLEDRISVYWSTGTVANAPAPLLVPGRSGTTSAPDVTPREDDAPESLMAWARLALTGDAYGWESRRLDLRGGSLLDPSFQGPGAFHDPSPPLEQLIAWVEQELQGRARRRGLGAYVARYIGRAAEPERGGAVRLALAVGGDADGHPFYEGLVRAASRGRVTLDRSHDEARLAARAGAAVGVRNPAGLAIAVGGLELLIRSGVGTSELRDAIRKVRREGGDAPGVEMWRIGLGLLHRSRRHEALPAYLDQVPGSGARWSEVATDVAGVLADQGTFGAGWEPALSGLWRRLIRDVDPAAEGLHRLAWTEHRRFGATALAGLVRDRPDGATLAFTRSFMASDPALPVFLELRRTLL